MQSGYDNTTGNYVAGGRGGAYYAMGGRGRGRPTTVHGGATHGSGFFDHPGSGSSLATQPFPATSSGIAQAAEHTRGVPPEYAPHFHDGVPVLSGGRPPGGAACAPVSANHLDFPSSNVTQELSHSAPGRVAVEPSYTAFIDDISTFDREHGLSSPVGIQRRIHALRAARFNNAPPTLTPTSLHRHRTPASPTSLTCCGTDRTSMYATCTCRARARPSSWRRPPTSSRLHLITQATIHGHRT